MSGRRGKEAEFLFDLKCAKMRYDVAVPITGDIEPYDRLFRAGWMKPWKTVQIKRVYLKGKCKSRTINLVKSNGEPYQHQDCDYIAAVDMETEDIWLIPINVMAGYTRRRINESYDRWKLK